MKKVFLIISILVCFPSALAYGNESIIFLHHSTGHNLYYEGGVGSKISNYNSENGTNFQITERAYPNTPYPWANYPYDYWNLWINGVCDSSDPDIECLDTLADSYDVVVWKHCFPGSAILSDTGSPDISSSRKSLENYKLQYRALRNLMDQYPDTVFIVWTLVPLHRLSTSSSNAARASEFVDWVKNTWLTEDGQPHDNIYLFDFWDLAAEHDPTPVNGEVNTLKYEYERSHTSGDSHPNTLANTEIGPVFAKTIIDSIIDFNNSNTTVDEPPVIETPQASPTLMFNPGIIDVNTSQTFSTIINVSDPGNMSLLYFDIIHDSLVYLNESNISRSLPGSLTCDRTSVTRVSCSYTLDSSVEVASELFTIHLRAGGVAGDSVVRLENILINESPAPNATFNVTITQQEVIADLSPPNISVVNTGRGVNVSVACPVDSWCQVRRTEPGTDLLLSDGDFTSGSVLDSNISKGVSYTYNARYFVDGVESLSSNVTIIYELPVSCLTGDLTEDGVVDINDLYVVVKDLGKRNNFDLRSDQNEDGVINVFDLVLVARYFGVGDSDNSPVFEDDFDSGALANPQNGYSWSGGVDVSVSDANPRGGSGYSLHGSYRASYPNNPNLVEQNFNFPQLTDFWMEFYWYIPENFYDREDPDGAENKKFLVIHAEDNGGGQDALTVLLNYIPMDKGNGESSLLVQWEVDEGQAEYAYRSVGINDFITNDLFGTWMWMRVHVKVGSTRQGSGNTATGDGVIEVWRNDMKIYENFAVPLLAISSAFENTNYLSHGYLLGAANGGFEMETSFDIDDVKFYDSDPGW